MFESDMLITRFLTLHGMRSHSFESVEMTIQIIASDKYPLKEMCTQIFCLDEVEHATYGRWQAAALEPSIARCAVDFMRV